MTIGFDVRCLMQKNYSGVSWYAFNLLTALLAIDQKNQYLLFYNSSKKVFLPDFKQPNVRYVGFNYPNKLFNLAVNFFNRPRFDKLLGGVDVFFVPNLHFVAVSRQCRQIITVHGLSFLRYGEFFNWRRRLWHRLVLYKRIIEQADLVVADSQSTKKDLLQFIPLSANRIKVVSLGIGEEYRVLDADLSLVKKKYGLPEKFVLSLGTLEPRKDIESVIEAYNLLETDCHLVIAGARGWKSKKIYRLAKNNAKIHLLGYLDEADKPAVYNLASVLAYPSYYEGFGLPLLEAMACGCPVIYGHNSSQGEVVGSAGLAIDPYNISEIKVALENILTDKSLRAVLAAAGLERAKSFSWEKTAREILAGIIEAAGKNI